MSNVSDIVKHEVPFSHTLKDNWPHAGDNSWDTVVPWDTDVRPKVVIWASLVLVDGHAESACHFTKKPGNFAAVGPDAVTLAAYGINAEDGMSTGSSETHNAFHVVRDAILLVSGTDKPVTKVASVIVGTLASEVVVHIGCGHVVDLEGTSDVTEVRPGHFATAKFANSGLLAGTLKVSDCVVSIDVTDSVASPVDWASAE